MERKNDISTEEKIKEAARKLFMQKGFTATKTRDIAQEAGLNLALLNYYYRSKEMLFNIIIMESMGEFFSKMAQAVNNKSTTLEGKFQKLTHEYISMIQQNPDLPLFILNEVSNPKSTFFDKVNKQVAPISSHLKAQMDEHMAHGKMDNVPHLHIIANCISLIIFPFIGAPILKKVTGVTNEEFDTLMEQRKDLIPHWMKRMFNMQ